jgi:hypothetical protein
MRFATVQFEPPFRDQQRSPCHSPHILQQVPALEGGKDFESEVVSVVRIGRRLIAATEDNTIGNLVRNWIEVVLDSWLHNRSSLVD